MANERELPPLRVRLLGDGTSFSSMVKQAKKDADSLAASISKATSNSAGMAGVRNMVKHASSLIMNAVELQIRRAAQHASTVPFTGAATVRRVVRQSVREILAVVELHITQLAASAGSVRAAGSADVRRTMREASRMVLHYLLISIRRMVSTSHSVASNGAQIRAVMRQATQMIQHYLLISIRRMVSTVHNVAAPTGNVRRTMRQAIHLVTHAITTSVLSTIQHVATAMANTVAYVGMVRRQIRQAIRIGLLAVLASIQLSLTQGIATINLQSLQNLIRNGLTRALRNGLTNLLNNLNMNNGPHPNPGGPRGRGGGGGMGDRADIYMHSGALKTMGSSLGILTKPMADIADARVSLEIFTKDAGKAAGIVKEMQEFAIVSPYGLSSLLDATSLMAKYGMETSIAADVTERLGSVAGGDAERMHRLAYAMGQIASVGHLTGMELRQLTEAGFNPLRTIAKLTAKSLSDVDLKTRYNELVEMRKKGLISSEAVIAALKVETSEGGDFAGILQKLSKELRGLANQIKETAVAVGLLFLGALEEDMKKALSTTLQFVQAFRKWAEENPKLVKKWAIFIRNIFIGVAAFHALGLAIAYARWMSHSLFLVAGTLTGGLLRVRAAIFSIVGAFTAMRSGAALAWLAALGPLNLILIGIAALVAWIVAATAAMMYFAVGWKNTLKYARMALGFMWNLGHNIGVIFKYMGQSWENVYQYMLKSLGPLAEAFIAVFTYIGSNIAVILGGVMGPIQTMLSFIFEELPKLMPDLKFDLPALPSLSEAMGLKLEPLGNGPAIPAQENHDWNALLGGNAAGKGAIAKAAPDAAIRGSSDHAVRKWEYAQKLQAAKQGNGAASPEQKKVSLLEEIAKNTRPQAGGLNIVNANLTGSAP